MSNNQVGTVYQQIIADVVESSRVDFEEGGVDEHVLEELRLVSARSLPVIFQRCIVAFHPFQLCWFFSASCDVFLRCCAGAWWFFFAAAYGLVVRAGDRISRFLAGGRPSVFGCPFIPARQQKAAAPRR